MGQEEKNHQEILKKICDLEKSFNERLDNMDTKIKPMYDVFNSVQGFNNISVWILKLLAALGAAILGFYAILQFFKKLST